MNLYLALAWRNIWRNKRRSIISISSILFAVMLAIMSRSMMIGTFGRMVDNIVSSISGYLQIHAEGYFDSQSLDDSFIPTPEMVLRIQSVDHVTQVVPRLESFALVSGGERTAGARITGIDPVLENGMTKLEERVAEGRYINDDDKGILLGEELAKQLHKTVGDTVILLGSGYHGLTAAGRYPVLGLLHFPTDEISASIAFLPMKEAQYLYGTEGRITTLAVMIEEPRYLEGTRKTLRTDLDESYEVITWKMMLPELEQLIQMKFVGQDLVLGLIYIIVGFGILGTVLMMTMERMREFGMVTAVGMKKRVLAIIVLIESSLLTLTGAIVAMIITWPIVGHLAQNPIILHGRMEEAYREYGFEPVIAFSLHFPLFLWQTLFVLLIALVSSTYPFIRIAKLNSVDAMRTGH